MHSKLLAAWLMTVVIAGALGLNQARASESVVFDPRMSWLDTCGVDPGTEDYTLDRRDDGSLRVTIREPGHGLSLASAVSLRIDPERTPILSMTYRAEGMQTDKPDRVVMLFYCQPSGTLNVLRQGELEVDGKTHTVRVDLRKLTADRPDEALERLDLRLYAGAEGDGVFDLIDVRVEGEGDAPADGEPLPVRVKVVDAASRPIAGAQVTLDAHLRQDAVTVVTDAAGVAVLTPESAHAGVRRSVTATKEGMTRIEFCDLSDVDGQTELLAMIRPTRTYSGKVVDETGEPVAGALGEVQLRGVSQPSDRPGHPRWRYDRRVLTDAQGRWTTAELPDIDGVNLQVRWMDGRYLMDQWGGQYSGSLSETTLRNGEAVSVLKRGLALSGTVYDKDGNPLAGAHVAQGTSLGISNPPPHTYTDEQGRYQFINTPPGELVLTVTARDHAPELVHTNAAADMEPIDFHLGEPAVFRVRVIDRESKPIQGATLHVSRWRGHDTIPQSRKADAEGYVTMRGPTDAVTFEVYAPGKLRESNLTLRPSRDEGDVTTITMSDPITVTLTVTDARTGEPIPNFNAVSGILWRTDDQPHWERDTGEGVIAGRDGKWTHTYTHPYPYRVMRVEAEGYAPAVSEQFAKESGNVSFTFALEPAESLTGTLVDAAGAPVGGVSVYLANGRSAPTIRNGTIERYHGSMQATTDADGRFTFPPQEGGYLLIAAHDAGYLEMANEAFDETDGVIPLQPWATLTGRVMIGDKPGAGTELMVSLNQTFDRNRQRPYHDIQFSADAQGYFTFDRVPAGEGSIGRTYRPHANSRGIANTEHFTAQPGETVEVQIGGRGRPVVGRLLLPEGVKLQTMTYARGSIYSQATGLDAQMKALMPDGFDAWDDQKKQAFMKSDEGNVVTQKLIALQRTTQKDRRHYNFDVSDDGSFRIENVEPGEYKFSVHVLPPPPEGGRMSAAYMHRPVAQYDGKFTVPALPQGATYLAEPLDLGGLALERIMPSAKPGDLVPDFTAPVIEAWKGDRKIDLATAEQLTLSSLQGKVVLLHFWMDGNGLTRMVLPQWQAVWKQFGDDPRFAMVGISLDHASETAAAFVEQNDMPWTQVYGERFGESKIQKMYEVLRLPSTWVIGVDGRLIALEPEDDAMIDVVHAALAKLPPVER